MCSFRIAVFSIIALLLLPATGIAGADDSSTSEPVFPSAGFSRLYQEIDVNLPDTYAGTDYTLPIDLTGVKYSDSYNLDTDQLAKLGEQGFVVVPSDYKQFHYIYESMEYDELPVFITVDSVYHVYHLAFDKLLRDMEREKLEPAIRSLTDALADAAAGQYEEALGTSMEGAAYGVLAYFSVARQLIEADSPPPLHLAVADVVASELKLIEAHNGIAVSPIFNYEEDYSQYVPRGHYTRDEQLQRYFRTMMWYGRMCFVTKDPDLARMTLLITRLLMDTEIDGVPAMDLWESVYDPTVFLVGKADDLSIYDMEPLIKKIYGQSPDIATLGDETLLGKFTDAVEKLPPPLINSMIVDLAADKESATRGFRFMGQRFVLDAYIFDELTMREVEDRWLPMGLDVFAAMGNEDAYRILKDIGKTNYVGYDDQLKKLRGQISLFDLETWTQNLYWNWLYSLRAIVEPKGDAYPVYMQTEAWADKDLHSALGSWTELKHDTILYAKQVYAECGDDTPPEYVRGYVEPNPMAFARLLALVSMTRAGLEEEDLVPRNLEYFLKSLEDLLVFLESVTERELNGGEINEREYLRMISFGGLLEWMTTQSADSDEMGGTPYFEQDEQVALVADVATGAGSALEEAVGRVFEIYVVVPDGVGGLQVTKGGVFSYYEFEQPISDRLTDESWIDMIEEGTIPERPTWTKSFIAE